MAETMRAKHQRAIAEIEAVISKSTKDELNTEAGRSVALLLNKERAEYQEFAQKKKEASHANEDSAIRSLGRDILEVNQKLRQQGRFEIDDLRALVALNTRYENLSSKNLTPGERSDLQLANNNIRSLANGIPITREDVRMNAVGNGTINEISWQLWQLCEKVKRGALFGNTTEDWIDANLEELDSISLRQQALYGDAMNGTLTPLQREASNEIWNQYVRVLHWATGKPPFDVVTEDDYKKIHNVLTGSPSVTTPNSQIRLLADELQALSASVQAGGNAWSASQKADLSGLRERFKDVNAQPALSVAAKEAIKILGNDLEGLDKWSRNAGRPSPLMEQHRNAVHDLLNGSVTPPAASFPSPSTVSP